MGLFHKEKRKNNDEFIPYLTRPVGTYLIRTEDGTFIEDDGSQEIHFEKQ